MKTGKDFGLLPGIMCENLPYAAYKEEKVLVCFCVGEVKNYGRKLTEKNSEPVVLRSDFAGESSREYPANRNKLAKKTLLVRFTF
jgi:hypothetical protein